MVNIGKVKRKTDSKGEFLSLTHFGAKVATQAVSWEQVIVQETVLERKVTPTGRGEAEFCILKRRHFSRKPSETVYIYLENLFILVVTCNS